MQVLHRGAEKGRVLFFIPRPLAPGPVDQSLGAPLESLAVAQAIADAGFEVVVFDELFDTDWRDEVTRLHTESTIACLWMAELYLYQIEGLRQFLTWRRETGSEIPVAAGGQLITVATDEMLLDCNGVSWFVHGVGEDILPKLCARVAEGKPADDLAGILTAPTNGAEPHRTEYRIPPRLESSWNAFYRNFDLTPYIERTDNIFGNQEPTLRLRLARGCAKGCRFCYHFRVRESRVDAKDAVDALKYLIDRYGVRQYTFYELDYFSDRERALEISQRVIDEKLSIRWFGLGSVVDLVRYTADDIALLKRSGLGTVEMGTESGSASILAKIGKRHQPEDAYHAAKAFLDQNIATVHNVIFGIPGETQRDRAQTVALVRRILGIAPGLVLFHPRLYQLTPRTPLGDEALRQMPESYPFPKTLYDCLDFRDRFLGERVFPWLGETSEQQIKDLSQYFLPMLQIRLEHVPESDRGKARWLKRFADWRCRHGRFELPFDRILFDRWLRPRITIVNAFAQ